MNWSQFQTILWLRWRLTRNQALKAGKANLILSGVMALLGLLFGVGGFIGGIALGMNIANAQAQTALFTLDGILIGFLIFWMIGLMVEIQRSEMINLSKLLHLPVSLQQVFVMNFLASFVTPSLIVFLPLMSGFCLGWGIRHPGQALALGGISLGFFFMVTAWTYCLRGWLTALMMNKRRRQTIMVVVAISAVLIGQIPNLLLNNPRMREKRQQDQKARMDAIKAGKKVLPYAVSPALLSIHQYVPVLWTSYSGYKLRQNEALPAILLGLASILLGAWGLQRAYLGTVKFYQGGAVEKGTAPASPPTQPLSTVPRPGKGVRLSGLLEKKLPFVSEQTSIVTLANLQMLPRAPEIKLAMMTPIIMLCVFGTMQFTGRSGNNLKSFEALVASGCMLMAVIGLLQLMSNLFGIDRNGFRALVLSPVPRRDILLAKNLALAPVALACGIFFLLILTIFFGTSPWTVLAALCQLIAAFFMVALVGNFCSIRTPYRVNSGSLQPTKLPAKAVFFIFVSHIFLMCLLVPIAIPAGVETIAHKVGYMVGLPINFILSLAGAAVVMVIYFKSLNAQGRYLQEREMEILSVVTHEVE